MPVSHPGFLEASRHTYQTIELVPTPPPVKHEPQRRLPPPVMVAHLDPPPAALRLAAPQPRPKSKVEDAPAPEVKIAEKKLDQLAPTAAPIIPKVVRTNVFSTGSPAAQTIARAPEKVQTGGFGDPNGVPAKTSQTQAVNIARAGGFDMPAGPGYGNGTGGASGAPGGVGHPGFRGGGAPGEQKPTAPADASANRGPAVVTA